jgi:hypothetical protein
MPLTPREHHVDEYDSERDMDAFWEAATPKSEPFRQWWYLPVLLLLIVFSVPWYRAAGSVGSIYHGLPIWVWTSLGCSFGVAVLTAFAILRYWKDGD